MRFLFILFVFVCYQAAGQSWYLKRNVDWMVKDMGSGDISIHELVHFRFAVYKEHELSLPYFSDVLE